MSPWPLWLLGALLLPPLGRILTDRADRRRTRWARSLKLSWMLLSLLLWSRLALLAGEHGAGGMGRSGALLTLLAGFLYFELAMLLAWPGTTPAHSAEARPAGPAGNATDAIPPEAEALLGRILGLDRISCATIMTPRERIVWVDGSAAVGQALAKMRAAGRSRVVVVGGGSLDRVLGIAHAKDLLPQALESGEGSSVRRHLRRWLSVSREETAAQLLEDFRRHRVHLAVVGDPLGRTLGLVTLGDVFRLLAGFDEPVREAADQEGRSS